MASSELVTGARSVSRRQSHQTRRLASPSSSTCSVIVLPTRRGTRRGTRLPKASLKLAPVSLPQFTFQHGRWAMPSSTPASTACFSAMSIFASLAVGVVFLDEVRHFPDLVLRQPLPGNRLVEELTLFVAKRKRFLDMVDEADLGFLDHV